MSLSLEYRFTFITVLEDVDFERSEALLRRSRSLPPRAMPLEMCEAHEEEEKDGRQYVQDLTKKLFLLQEGEEIPSSPRSEDTWPMMSEEEEELPMFHTNSLKSTGTEEELPMFHTNSLNSTGTEEELPMFHTNSLKSTGTEEEFPMFHTNSLKSTGTEASVLSDFCSAYSAASNPGSVGHPELCRRPCIYFQSGECRNSESCNFCHLSHAHRSATLDKNQRQMIKELTQYELLNLLLRGLRNKAVQGNFEAEAKAVLELFEERLQALPREASKAGTKVGNLEKALSRMTFFSVASLTTRAQLDKDFLATCKALVGKLRQHFD